MKRGTPDHPKTHALAAELQIERYAAVGLLEMLWHFTAHYAKRGNVGRHTDLAIARAIGWSGDPEALIRGLVACGWLDRCGCHRLVVHDWAKHADQGVGRSEEVKTEGFISCERQKLDDSSSPLDKDSLPLPCLAVALPLPEPVPVAPEARETALDPSDPLSVDPRQDGAGKMAREKYCETAWRVYLERRGTGELPAATSTEWALLLRWYDQGIPIRAVYRGMADTKGRGRNGLLTYYGKSVEGAWAQMRQAAGFGAAAPLPP